MGIEACTSEHAGTPLRSRAAALLVLNWLAGSPAPAAGAAECTVPKPGGFTLADSIALAAGPGLPRRVLDAAIELWAACANYGSSFPRLVQGTSGSRVIQIESATAPVGNRCGSFSASSIRLHGVARAGGRTVFCDAPVRILAHEIGHALGLADAPDGEVCRDHIMAHTFHGPEQRRRVQPSECQAVGQRWLTPAEHEVVDRLVNQWNEAGRHHRVGSSPLGEQGALDK
jgi:hypothetical protein